MGHLVPDKIRELFELGMINIDFQGGMHGNYLEYVCNRFLAGIDIRESTPFNQLGAAHIKTYEKSPIFRCGHFSTSAIPLDSDRVIRINITKDDLLAAQCISLLRAGDHDIQPHDLEHDTYNKLNNHDYRWVLDNLIGAYFDGQIVQSYQAVMDESWPKIHSAKDFDNLPNEIKKECLHQHGLFLHEFSVDQPDCPRYILREFFKLGFKSPDDHGFMKQQEKFQYPGSVDVYNFPFSCFYDFEKFYHEIESVGAWAGFHILESIQETHQQFLQRQIFKDVKQRCDELIFKIMSNNKFPLPNLSLIEEAYVDAEFERFYNLSMPLNQKRWFQNSSEIYTIIGRAK